MKSNDIVKIENLSSDENVFKIRWRMTYLCNYSCDFCIQGNKAIQNEKSKGESIEIREKICNNIVNLIETKLNNKYKKIVIYLIGGEVTILQDFTEILKKLVNCKFDGQINIHITTNLSTDDVTLEEIRNIMSKSYENKRNIIISASYYKEYTNEEQFMKKIGILYKEEKMLHKILRTSRIIKKIKAKIKRKKAPNKYKKGEIYVNINYPLCQDDEYKEYKKFKRKYKKQVKNINYIVIRDYHKSISDKLKKKLQKKKVEKIIKVTTNNKVYYIPNMSKIVLLIDEKHFNPNGYLCNIGINSITISNLGIVSRCLDCEEQTKIGDMKIGDLNELPTQKLKCTSNKCNCSYYGVIEKDIIKGMM